MRYCNFKDSPFLRLENIHRFSNRDLSRTDSDSDHTIRIQLYLLETYRNVGPGTFNLERACFKALVHDLDEIGCADVPRSFKYHDEKILSEIRRVGKETLKELELPEDLIYEIDNSKDDTIEGKLIEFFDVVDAYRTLNRESWTMHSEQLSEDAEWSLNFIIELMHDLPDYFPPALRAYLGRVTEDCKRDKVHLK